MLKRIIPIASW